MKSLKNTLLATVASLALVAGAYASPPLETRMNVAEKVGLTLPVDVSNTVYSATRYAVASPVRGRITGLYFTYEGPNAITSGTSAIIVAKVGGVSATDPSLTVPSGTTVLAAVSDTAAYATATKVKKGEVIEFALTGSPIMAGAGGKGRITLEITPDYVKTSTSPEQ